MDPVTAAIVAGLAAGVAGGATDVGKKVVVDAYAALKAALQHKYGVDSDLVEAIEHLEKKPEAPAREAGVKEEVEATQANQDEDVLTAAQTLLKALQNNPEGQQALGKYQIDISGGQVGVIGDDAHIEGGINFGTTPNKPQEQ